jgi:colanic acid/amylovoran biosynthesis protein
MKRVLLLGAGFDTGNLGVDALACGALTVIGHSHPGAKVDLLDYGREPALSRAVIGGREREIDLVNLRFSWKILLPNSVVALLVLALVARLGGPRWRAWIVSRNRWLAAVAGADAALAVSGGDSFSDIYGMGRLWYVCLPQLLVLAVGVPLTLLPQTIGPFRRATARSLARFILRRAARVNARDVAGVDDARRLIGSDGQASVAFCPDLAFVLDARPPAHAQATARGPARQLVGLNVSGLLAMGGYGGGNMFGLGADYRALTDRLVAWFIDDGDADVLLVPHVRGGGAESDVGASEAVLQRLGPRFGDRLRVARGDYTASEAKSVIGGCDFFVGARMHACIAALSQGVPAVGLAYSDKFAGVFASVGAADAIADQRRLSLDETLALVARRFGARAADGHALSERLPGVRAQVLALLGERP